MTPHAGRRRRLPRFLRRGRLLGLGLLLAVAPPMPVPALAPPIGHPWPGAIEPLVVDPAGPDGREGWLVGSGQGPLRWRPLGARDWRPAWAGRIVPYASEVEAGAGAWASLVAGGTRVALRGDARVALLRPDEAEGVQRVRQDGGRARYRVDPSPTRPAGSGRPGLEVITPMLVATVKGTVFDVEVGDDRAVEVRVVRGLVGVAPRTLTGPAASSDVGAGQGYRLAAAAVPPELFRLSDGGRVGGALALPPWLTAAAVALSMLLALTSFALLGRDGAVLAGALRQRWLDRPGGKARRRRKLLRGG